MNRIGAGLHVSKGRILPAAVIFLTLIAAVQSGGQPAVPTELAPGSEELIEPPQLLKAMQAASEKPLVLYVGPSFLYKQAHIPGAEFIGPASDPASLDNLRKRMSSLPKTTSIVLYCGCCPWDHCPNIRPAYKELQKAGFKRLKALYLAKSFGVDWVDKGYPTEKGQ